MKYSIASCSSGAIGVPDTPREPAAAAGQWVAARCAPSLHRRGDSAFPASGSGTQGQFAGQAGQACEADGIGEQRLGGSGVPGKTAETPAAFPIKCIN